MKTTTYLFAAFAALALTACSNDDEPKTGSGNVIRLTGSMANGLNVAEGRAATGIQTSAFDAGETVDVYITENNPGTTATTYPQPIEYTTAANGALNAGTAYYYPTSGNGVNIYALYPATAAAGSTFSVAADQSTDANYKASDLMYGKPATNPVNPGSNPVQIQFSHLLSKVTINLKAGDYVTSLDGAKVELMNVLPSTTLTANTTGGSISTATGTATDITVMTATSTETSGSAIIVPQTLQETFLRVTLNGATLTGKLDDGAPTLTAGNVHTYDITVNLRGEQLVITSSITPWTTGTGGTGSVNPQ